MRRETIKAHIGNRLIRGVSKRTAYAFLSGVMALSSIMAATASVDSGDLGVIGPVYSIKEQDLIEYIKNRITAMQRSGEMKKLQEKQLKRAKKHINRPVPVAGITRTLKARVFFIDPSIRVDHAINDHKGRVIVMPGTTVNPFDYISMSKHLLFINGDAPDQVLWALSMNDKYHGHTKAILVNGSPIEVMKRTKHRFFFDQKGVLTKKFQIKHVPAIVSQQKKLLRVAEVVP